MYAAVTAFAALHFAAAAAAEPRSPTPIAAQAAFEKLKGLAGEWRGTEGEKGKGSEVMVLYKTTANGSAVMETLFPGTDHEMVTLYHMDGDKLILTHYCAVGNQPKMALTSKSTADELGFDFAGGTNFKPAEDMHMHGLRIRFEGKDAIATEWDLFQSGKKVDTKKFFFSRKA